MSEQTKHLVFKHLKVEAVNSFETSEFLRKVLHLDANSITNNNLLLVNRIYQLVFVECWLSLISFETKAKRLADSKCVGDDTV